MNKKGIKNWSTTKLLTLGFAVIVMMGTLLLELPIATRDGSRLDFLDALFTATSATCVTGLVVFDTYTKFSLFGQVVILLLIQIGGLGFITVALFFSLVIHRRIGLRERAWMADGVGSLHLTGIVRMGKRILLGTFFFEGIGAVLLSIRFIPVYGFWDGLWFSIFHSISAFCNAGFDLMGASEAFSSLTAFYNDPLVILTISTLIIVGGIGFIVWTDFVDCKFDIRKISYHTKVVLSVTAVLLAAGTIVFFFSEKEAAMAGMSEKERLLASFFQSVTPRTAGFNSIDIASLSYAGNVFTMFLMFVGAAPGGTAGGVKITTFIVVVAAMYASQRKNADTVLGHYRIDEETTKRAFCNTAVYCGFVSIGVFVLCTQKIDVSTAIFESLSAIGTVGLGLVEGQDMTVISKIVLILLMYTGRVGSLTVFVALTKKQNAKGFRKPVKKILIG